MTALAQSLEDEVNAAYTVWDAGFAAADAEAIGVVYTDDAVFLPATHDVIKGPAGVSNFFKGLFGMGVTGHKLELIEADADGDLVVAGARWSAADKDAAGTAQP